MPYYMDRHDLQGSSAAAIAAAHLHDSEVQERFGVEYLTYWYDHANQRAFCLATGPNRDVVNEVHRVAHGNVASEIIEVDQPTVERYMGPITGHPLGEAYEDSALRAIVFTDLVGSTDLTQKLGDAGAMEILRRHDTIVRDAITGSGGSEVKHTGDGIMASFRSIAGAIEAAVRIQRDFEAAQASGVMPARVRIGIAAGEPVAQAGDLFGTTVQLAARLTAKARPGAIVVHAGVRDLAQGKGFSFARITSARLKGFAEPQRICEVEWQQTT